MKLDYRIQHNRGNVFSKIEIETPHTPDNLAIARVAFLAMHREGALFRGQCIRLIDVATRNLIFNGHVTVHAYSRTISACDYETQRTFVMSMDDGRVVDPPPLQDRTGAASEDETSRRAAL